MNDLEYLVWDGLIEDLFLHQLDFDTSLLEYTFDVSGGGAMTYPYDLNRGYRIWGRRIFQRNSEDSIHNRFTDEMYGLWRHLSTRLLNDQYTLQSAHINGQTLGMDGGIHKDVDQPNPYTLMVFINHKWEKQWGGEFQILDGEEPDSKVLKTIEYVPGRVIFFNGELWHRALAPKENFIFRRSLVFKLSKLDGQKN